MSATASATLTFATRDGRREVARKLGLEQKFCEKLVNASFDRTNGVLHVHPFHNGKATGRLAVCGDLANLKQAALFGSRGLWHAPRGQIKGAPAVLALDFDSVRDAFYVGSNGTLLCVDPTDLPKMNGAEWTHFLDDGLCKHLEWYHSEASAMLIVHGPRTRVRPDALDSIMSRVVDYCSVPVLQLPDFCLRDPDSTSFNSSKRMLDLVLRLSRHPCRAILNSLPILPTSWQDK